MGGINQTGKEVVTFHFCLKWVHLFKFMDLSISFKRNIKKERICYQIDRYLHQKLSQ